MEFYLLEDLDFHLIVFHPYRDLVALCARYDVIEFEQGEQGEIPIEERFWGTGQDRLDLDDALVRTAWYGYRLRLVFIADCALCIRLGSSSTTRTAPSSVSSIRHT
jgi:hypothetical protein